MAFLMPARGGSVVQSVVERPIHTEETELRPRIGRACETEAEHG